MRTLKKALSLVLVLALLCSVCVFSASASNFTDDADIEYTEAVDVLVQIGVIDGMGDGTFNPNGNLTRAQAAKIICYLLLGSDTNKLEASTQNSTFTDVIGSGHDWASPYIEYCVNAGIVGGYGDGRFGPGDQLTGFQFGKMLLCALGYDADIEGYVGSAWTVAVATDIIAADLDDGLPGGFNYNAPLTREEACQMAFNTLKADMVEYATKGTTIVTGDGTTVVTGASTADPMRNNKTTDGNIDLDAVMQFAEYYFQDLKLTEGHEDDFGRPSNTWKNGTTEIGTYTDKTDLIATYDGKVTKGTLYNLIGKSNVKDLKDNKCELNVYVDGVWYNPEPTFDTLGAYIDGYFNSGDSSTFASLLKDGSQMGEGHGGNFIDATGNGSRTEVYQDKDGNVIIVVINEYLVKAAGDYNATKDELKVDLVNVDDINEYTPAGIALDDNALSADDFPAVAKGAEDDYFVVTMAAVNGTYNGKFEIKSAEPAKLVSGTVDTFTQNLFKVEFGTVTLDGSAYNYGLLAAWHDGYEAAYSVGEKAVVVTDSKGFILYVDDAVAVDKYVFVYEFGSDSATLSRLSQNKADAFFIDGTDAVITVDTVKDANKEKIADPQPGWYSYSVGSDGKYKLTLLEKQDMTADFSDAVLVNGRLNCIEGVDVKGNSATTIIVYDDENDEINVYNGATKAPDVKLLDGGSAEVYYTMNSKGNLEYIFVSCLGDIDIDDGAANTELVYILWNDGTATDGKDNTYVQVESLQNQGNWAYLNFAEGDFDPKDDCFQLVYKVKTNSDGYATGFTTIAKAAETKPDDYFFSPITGQAAFDKGTLSFGDVSMDVSDTDIYLIVVSAGNEKIVADPGIPADFSNMHIKGSQVKNILSGYEVVAGTAAGVRADDGSDALTCLYITVFATAPVGNTPQADTYAVTVEAAENGTVTADKTEAEEGETVTLTAEPAEGYAFEEYVVTTASGEEVTVGNGMFTMPGEAVTVTAVFHEALYDVTVTQPENGTVTADKTSAAEGDTVNLTAEPAEGYAFEEYVVTTASGEEVTVGNGMFTMPGEAVTVTAVFHEALYDVTVTQPENGTVTADKTSAAEGDTVNLTAEPAEGYAFEEYVVTTASGEEVTVGNNKFTMPGEAVTVTAVFHEALYDVTIADDIQNGTVTADKTSAAEGDTVNLTAEPAEGYAFEEYVVTTASGEEVTVSNNKFTMPGEAVTVTAVFHEVLYTVTIADDIQNGTVTADKTSAAEGDTVILTVTPVPPGVDESYAIDAVTYTVEGSDTPITVEPVDGVYSIVMPAGNITVSAVFINTQAFS